MGDDTGVRSESESCTLAEGSADGDTICFCFFERGLRVGRADVIGPCADTEGEKLVGGLPVSDTELLGFNGDLFFPRFEDLIFAFGVNVLSSPEPSVSSE
jgi:hypothetical protein